MPISEVYNMDCMESVSYTHLLRAIEQSFYKEYKQLESDNKDADYDSLCDRFYDSYVNMQEALKTLLAETTEINILHSL